MLKYACVQEGIEILNEIISTEVQQRIEDMIEISILY